MKCVTNNQESKTDNDYSPYAPYELSPDYNNLDGKTRYERALVILQGVNNIRKVQGQQHAWMVKSQSIPTRYYVQEHEDGTFSCNCADHIKHQNDCKHIIAVKLNLEAQAKRKEERQKNRKTRPRDKDWSEYNKGMCDEFTYFEKYLRELTSLIEQPPHENGRPRLPQSEVAFQTINRVAHQLSSRRGTSLNPSDEIGQYNYTASTDFLKAPETTAILRNLLHISAKPFIPFESSFSVDSTGFNTRCYHEWSSEKWGTIHKRDFVKCHFVIGNTTNIITDALITDETVQDDTMFRALVDETSHQFKIGKVLADAGYVDEKNFKYLDSIGADVFIMFKKNSTYDKKCPSWKNAFEMIVNNPERFYEVYKDRNNVESTCGAIKDKYGETLKSRKLVSQRNEVYCKLIAYNIANLIRYQMEMQLHADYS